MTKIRMTGMPNDYGLVEETDLNGNNASTRRIPIKRRLLADDEKIYGIQRLWNSNNSKFVLVKKAEYSETTNSKAFTDKFLFRSLTRQKSVDRESHEGTSLERSMITTMKIDRIHLDLHLDHQSKHRTPNSISPNSSLNGTLNHNRAARAATPPTSKTHPNTKRSLKTIFSAGKS